VSRLSELLRQVQGKDLQLAVDLKREFEALSKRRAFGLNFERHVPETVELPGRPIRRGDKVRFLPERGKSPGDVDHRLWRAKAIRRAGDGKMAELVRELDPNSEPETATRAVDDLVVVAEFRDPIYPGLVSTGKVERGGDKPFHTVINAENFHALQALLYTHEGNVDAIYIDPPYNTGARDWKYNNDYVDNDDAYRHSKWLAMMERRLKLAKRLLNPEGSVLIVTIDEKEYLRLGLLLQQIFVGAQMQMISSLINPKGTGRTNEFRRVDEYLYFVWQGAAKLRKVEPSQARAAGDEDPNGDSRQIGLDWQTFRRRDLASVRRTRPGQFYPIYVNTSTGMIEGAGDPLDHETPIEEAPQREGCVAVFPVRPDGTEMNWAITVPSFYNRWQKGYLRAGKSTPNEPQKFIIQYLKSGVISDIEAGRAVVTSLNSDGSVNASYKIESGKIPTTQWKYSSHNAEHYGTRLLGALVPGRRFPFPKSLYAVEDALRLFVGDNPRAVVVDFFSGSGTTAQAVMRLNHQDAGYRQTISITNNEVSADDQAGLREKQLRPGDPEWERLGIFEYITKPRITAAITGKTPEGEPIKGNYKFTDEFPMADGFDENVEFFTMTYEAPRPVAHHRSFEAIAPLLWLKAGAQGRRIEKPTDNFDIADTYGVLFDLDQSHDFIEAIGKRTDILMAFVVTDDDRAYQAVCSELPVHVEPVRLYESYLTSFTINTGKE
jgi:adenine-specific DNA-methyltransferase